jgi:hypothetical protein
LEGEVDREQETFAITMMKKIQRAITPESGLLEYPMGHFVYAFYSLVNESICGEINHNDLINSLKDLYQWTQNYAEDIISDALRQGLITRVRMGSNTSSTNRYGSIH